MATKSPNTLLTQLIKNEPAAFALLKPGDLVDGTVLEKGARRLLVDLGKFGVGVVYRGELLAAREAVKGLKPGDQVHAKVIAVDNDEGLVELSLAEAGRQKAWAAVLELQEKGEPFAVKITSFNKGGVTTKVAGLPAFLPVSQLGGEHYPKIAPEGRSELGVALAKLVGEEIMVKILDANPRTEKLILSEREAMEVSTRELVKNYEVGQVVEGIVSGVADFGVFVRFTDNPALEGLIHISELSHRVVENPKEVVKVDDVVKVKIADIKDGRISLSLKALQADPWADAAERFAVGQEVMGAVYSFNPFGAIVTVGDLQGQLHVTEFGSVEEMKGKVALGKSYGFVVQDVKPAERRLVLKLKE
ncbi:30S ribosomal protein S1 [Candidatus Jorgensenbacteria bacterium CG10_big_fil_rev_8_21_14_0_10_54_38]|uniref:30S ribosomal protein S1 n=2 Tax=Candidatus Joergenseniibacteriota TaxID=1752739 RepID=A0A2M6WG41_9BACT|nr:MAG: 30S ribosomal protein S1 [Candidatus Jorgensenbacteria bacterium CG23_combo_of_CG06-09_8_20_14_all_54_14]PIT91773.1 MAG: 30S ribosomal protein S1 [Candidatus Jorgensenbacteria bacterium CG10_big_fil_rev_8_21_14_0_10_54_38]